VYYYYLLFNQFLYYYHLLLSCITVVCQHAISTTGPSLRHKDRHTVTHSNTGSPADWCLSTCQSVPVKPATDLSNVADFGGSLASSKNLSASCRDVLLLGPRSFDNFLTSIKTRMEQNATMLEFYEREVETLQLRMDGTGDVGVKKQLEKAQRLLDDERDVTQALEKLYDESKKNWSEPNKRIFGHIIHSPPFSIGNGTEGFTEDYAVVELDDSKIKHAFISKTLGGHSV